MVELVLLEPRAITYSTSMRILKQLEKSLNLYNNNM